MAPTKRQVTIDLAALYRFILSLVVICGGLTYLYLARPDQIIAAPVLALFGTIVTYWFLRKPEAPDDP